MHSLPESLEIGPVTVRAKDRGVFEKRRSRIALVTVTVGKTVVAYSKWHDESSWCADTLFHGGRPSFVHGEGSRSCRKSSPVKALADAMDAKLAEVGGFDSISL